MKQEILHVKQQIKKIAKYFDLKNNEKWMTYLFIPREANILIEYYGVCPDPDYNKFGKEPKTRLKNINRFINSKYFKEHMKRWGGQTYSKKGFNKDLKSFKKIEDSKIKKILFKTLKEIKSKLKISAPMILLTKPRSKKELRWTMNFILRHELNHILLEKNDISFQKKGNKYWKYDEGLVTYCDFLVENKFNKLDEESKKSKYKDLMEKWYFIYAIKFRELLKDKNTAKERKRAILEVYRKLKKVRKK